MSHEDDKWYARSDPDLIRRAQWVCDRGILLPDHDQVRNARLKRIVREDDAGLARYLVPQLLELIERRGLAPPMVDHG